MWRFLTPLGLVALALTLVACGGGDDGTVEPTTGVPVSGGKCRPDQEAFNVRREQVKSGELSQKQAEIDEITEVRTCEIERNLIKSKSKICSVEVGQALLDGRMTEQQAKQFSALQEQVQC